jgi:uncharacterized protein YndB with AHSA1/START domain
MIINILIGLGVLIAGLLGFAATRPNEFRLQRRTRINATPEKVFANLVDFHQWSGWSPWEKLDPGMQRKHSGAPSGKGAVYEWEGNRKVGKGRMEITDASAPNRLVVDLHFLKPYEARNTTEFVLQRDGAATDVTWSMYGPAPFVNKVMGVFMNMDKLIGTDFEKGLTSLKSMSEA